MSYLLLTGATGLLGASILGHALRDGRRVAVLLRPGRAETIAQRVELICSRWERELGYCLPRPVLLEGDLSQADLGLDTLDVRWIERNCGLALHSAASLTFESGARDEEPWRTNLGGTHRLLELCQRTGIREFHYVSTAYVCGLRDGCVRECELDVGQSFANDYERSKAEAEKLVRQCEFLASTTIYRPSIIVGHSRTGHTTTFHGFYTPLKIMHALLGYIDSTTVSGSSYLGALGLTGQEKKNFVPVDWVADVIMRILDNRCAHGGTYHITSSSPVTTAVVADVVEEVLRWHVEQGGANSAESAGPATLEELFREQMGVYRSYWRGDPEFDRAHVLEVLPDVPCPPVDRAMLIRLAKFAVRTNFGWPRPPVPPMDMLVETYLRRWLEAGRGFENNGNGTKQVGLQVNGSGGGQWTLYWDYERIVAAHTGLPDPVAPMLYLTSRTFRHLVTGSYPISDLVDSGSVFLDGQWPASAKVVQLLDALRESHGGDSLRESAVI